MSKNLRKCLKTIKFYTNTNNTRLKASILKEMSKNDNYFKALHEIVHNISVEKLKIPKLAKKKLKKHVKLLDKILCKPKSKIKRASLVNQSGGVWPILAPIVIEVVTELIRNAISKKN